jgi:hypothetical protein
VSDSTPYQVSFPHQDLLDLPVYDLLNDAAPLTRSGGEAPSELKPQLRRAGAL